MKLNIKDCMHPGDLAGVNAIKAIPKFGQLLDFISSSSFERYYKMFAYGSNIKLTRNNAPVIFDILDETVETFGISEDNIPDIFIERSYDYYVHLLGVKEPMMVISTSVLENLSPEELRIYLIPYFASIEAGHHMMSFIKMLLENYGSLLPIPEEVFKLPIYQWSKQKDYTYDRIRLIFSDSLEETACYIGIGESTREIMEKTSLEDRLETSQKIVKYNTVKSAVRNIQAIGSDDAWNAMRLIEIFNWYESGAFTDFKNKFCNEGGL